MFQNLVHSKYQMKVCLWLLLLLMFALMILIISDIGYKQSCDYDFKNRYYKETSLNL